MELFEIAYTAYKNCINLDPKNKNITKLIDITKLIFGVDYKNFGWSLNNKLRISHFIIQSQHNDSLMTTLIYNNKINVRIVNKHSPNSDNETFNKLTDFINIYRKKPY